MVLKTSTILLAGNERKVRGGNKKVQIVRRAIDVRMKSRKKRISEMDTRGVGGGG